jgi:hypothetical protein
MYNVRMHHLSHFQVRNPKDDETPIESATQIFASLLSYPYVSPLKRIIMKPKTYAFELFLLGQTIYYYVTTPKEADTLVQSLLTSSFPMSFLQKTTDPLATVLKSKHLAFGQMHLNSSFYLPVKTYMDFKDIDPMSSLIGFLSKQEAGLRMAIQIAVTPASFAWQHQAMSASKQMTHDLAADKYTQNPQKLLIMRKASFQGGKVAIRLIVGSQNDHMRPLSYLQNLAGTFGSFSLGEGNQFVLARRRLFKDRFIKRTVDRKIGTFENQQQILNAQELATIWHPPGYLMAGIRNISWGKTLLGEPPEQLPIPTAARKSTPILISSQKLNLRTKSRYLVSPTAIAANICT